MLALFFSFASKHARRLFSLKLKITRFEGTLCCVVRCWSGNVDDCCFWELLKQVSHLLLEQHVNCLRTRVKSQIMRSVSCRRMQRNKHGRLIKPPKLYWRRTKWRQSDERESSELISTNYSYETENVKYAKTEQKAIWLGNLKAKWNERLLLNVAQRQRWKTPNMMKNLEFGCVIVNFNLLCITYNKKIKGR